MFTEWVKGLLAVPFVLYSQPTGIVGDGTSIAKMSEEAHRRYAEIMRDVEMMIDDHSENFASSPVFLKLMFGSCAPEPKLAISVQARDAGSHSGTVLHETAARGRIQVPRPQTLHFLSPLCCAFIQRCTTCSQLGSNHGRDQRHPAARDV